MAFVPVTTRPADCPFFTVAANRWLDNRGIDTDTGWSMPDQDGWHLGITTRRFREAHPKGKYARPWAGHRFYVLVRDRDPRWCVGTTRKRYGEVLTVDQALDIIIERDKLWILDRPGFEALKYYYSMRQVPKPEQLEQSNDALDQEVVF